MLSSSKTLYKRCALRVATLHNSPTSTMISKDRELLFMLAYAIVRVFVILFSLVMALRRIRRYWRRIEAVLEPDEN